ncbi:MAG TPA: tetratricopeptide repeat protein [Ktedonobacteraceae bacterium]|nr:tetratricopeptide repeat protein [Ktedonobacteraceae bacterium]
MEAKMTPPLKLFYCYAQGDKAERDELDQHLAGVKRKYHIVDSIDQEISPDNTWQKDIESRLNTAHIILLLVSARFMAANYFYSEEMKRAVARHEEGTACVIPILLHPVYLGNAPFGNLRGLPPNAVAVSQWNNRDEVLWNIAGAIAGAIAEMLQTWPSKEEWILKGNALYAMRRYEEGLEACEQALYLDPRYVGAWSNKGFALNELKRYEEGLAAYDQALRLDPNYIMAWNNKGNTLYELQRYAEGLAAYEQALRLDPSNVVLWNNRGNALYGLGRYEDGLKSYTHALRLDPHNRDAQRGRYMILEEMKKSSAPVAAREADKRPVEANRRPSEADRRPPEANRRPLEADKRPVEADRRPPEVDRRLPEADRRPSEADRRSPEANRRPPETDKKPVEVDKRLREKDKELNA